MASRASQYRPVEPALVEQRCADRHVVFVSRTSIRAHGETPAPAALHDLSIYGCRLSTGEALQPGERMWLRFEGGMPIAATAVWSNDGMLGCRFDEPVERTLVRALTLCTR